MTIRKVLRAGVPSLRESSERYPEGKVGSKPHQRLLDDMFETMRDYAGVGLAAPQVQENVRLLVYEIRETERYNSLDETVPPTVMVNPSIVERADETTADWEGCLSLPDLRGKVPRSDWIDVEYLDKGGNQTKRRIEGFEARVVQHETDHLKGTLFVDRMESLESLCFFDEYQRFHDEEG